MDHLFATLPINNQLHIEFGHYDNRDMEYHIAGNVTGRLLEQTNLAF
jgi:hypothetical protein